MEVEMQTLVDVVNALAKLDAGPRTRVLEYANQKYGHQSALFTYRVDKDGVHPTDGSELEELEESDDHTPPEKLDEMLTIPEAAKLIGIADGSAYQAVKVGKLKAEENESGRKFVRRADALTYKARSKRAKKRKSNGKSA